MIQNHHYVPLLNKNFNKLSIYQEILSIEINYLNNIMHKVKVDLNILNYLQGK